MPTYEISFYGEFSCRAGECAETCCRGWKVSVDDDAFEKYRRLHSLMGLRIRLTLLGRTERCFDTSYRACPFYNKEGLCGIQLKYGHDHIPEVCRTYPRLCRNYGFLQEKWLDLSCIEAACLFLSKGTDFRMTGTEAEEAYEREGNNDDEAFFKELIESRQEIAAFIKRGPYSKKEDLDRAFQSLLSFGTAAEQGAIKDDYSFFQRELADFYAGDSGKSLFPLPMELFRKMICDGGFYKRSLCYQLPFLDEILQLFLLDFSDAEANEAQGKWEKLCNAYLGSGEKAEDGDGRPYANCRGILGELADYYCYGIWQNYLQSFEDYSFSKWLLRSIVDVNFFFLFSALFWQKHGGISRQEKAHIMSVLERRMHHNPTQSKRLMEGIREYLRDSAE